MKALALDLGTKRIGIAVSADRLAVPFDVLQRTNDKQRVHRTIAEHVAEHGADVLVVGLPLSLDGSIGPAAQRAIDEADELRAVVDIPVVLWDERLSTVEAERSLQLQDLDGKARRKIIDKIAATVILQAWLDSQDVNDE